MKKVIMLICIMLICTMYATEREEQARLAELPRYNAETERVLWDKTRCDMLFVYKGDSVACEVDWAKKWAEGIGQALYYGEVTNLKPAVLLLVKDMDEDMKYVYRCQTVCEKYDILLFVEQTEGEE